MSSGECESNSAGGEDASDTSLLNVSGEWSEAASTIRAEADAASADAQSGGCACPAGSNHLEKKHLDEKHLGCDELTDGPPPATPKRAAAMRDEILDELPPSPSGPLDAETRAELAALEAVDADADAAAGVDAEAEEVVEEEEDVEADADAAGE